MFDKAGPRRDCGPTRLIASCAIAAILAATPLAALDLSGHGSGLMLTGSGSGHYDGGEMGDLARTVLTVLYVLLSEEEDWRGDCYEPCFGDEELRLSIPQAQYGLGLSYGLTSSVSLGARLVYRHDMRNNDISRLWGGGPEIVYFLAGAGESVRPYLGAGLYLTRGTDRMAAETVAQGSTVNVRAGVSVRGSDSVGYFVQTSFQRDRLAAHRIPVMGKSLGLGMGLTVFID